MKWVSAVKRLPRTNVLFGESDYVLCYTKSQEAQFVGWYNSINHQWYVGHYKASNKPIDVDYWKKLGPDPEVKVQRKRINGI